MNKAEDQAYFVVKDTSQRTKSTLPEYKRKQNMILLAAARRPGGFVQVNRFLDIDKAMDPLEFIDFHAPLRRK